MPFNDFEGIEFTKYDYKKWYEDAQHELDQANEKIKELKEERKVKQIYLLMRENYNHINGETRVEFVRSFETLPGAKLAADKDYGSKVRWKGFLSCNTWNLNYTIKRVKVER